VINNNLGQFPSCKGHISKVKQEVAKCGTVCLSLWTRVFKAQMLKLGTPFSLACWSSLQLTVPNSQDIGHIVESLKLQLQLPYYMEILITMRWSIWTMRNDLIFRNIPHSMHRYKQVFRKEFALIILRAKPKFYLQIDLWLQAFV
jgi:hypothetical protein